MRKLRILGALALVGTLGFIAFAQDGEGETETQPVADIPLVIPNEAHGRVNPMTPNDTSLASGKRLFSSQCAMCHGANGTGKGDLAVRLKMAIPDFSKASWQKSRTDGDLFYIITEGHGRMRGQQDRLKPEFKWNMINHVRTFDGD